MIFAHNMAFHYLCMRLQSQPVILSKYLKIIQNIQNSYKYIKIIFPLRSTRKHLFFYRGKILHLNCFSWCNGRKYKNRNQNYFTFGILMDNIRSFYEIYFRKGIGYLHKTKKNYLYHQWKSLGNKILVTVNCIKLTNLIRLVYLHLSVFLYLLQLLGGTSSMYISLKILQLIFFLDLFPKDIIGITSHKSRDCRIKWLYTRIRDTGIAISLYLRLLPIIFVSCKYSLNSLSCKTYHQTYTNSATILWDPFAFQCISGICIRGDTCCSLVIHIQLMCNRNSHPKYSHQQFMICKNVAFIYYLFLPQSRSLFTYTQLIIIFHLGYSFTQWTLKILYHIIDLSALILQLLNLYYCYLASLSKQKTTILYMEICSSMPGFPLPVVTTVIADTEDLYLLK